MNIFQITRNTVQFLRKVRLQFSQNVERLKFQATEMSVLTSLGHKVAPNVFVALYSIKIFKFELLLSLLDGRESTTRYLLERTNKGSF